MRPRPKLSELNEHLVCKLCCGYMIDATSMTECPHSFCRSCILRYIQSSPKCPVCEKEVNPSQLQRFLRTDHTLQDLIYKLVPGLYKNELQKRKDFYTQLTNAQSGSPTAQTDGFPGRRIRQKIFDKHLVELAAFICTPEEMVSLSVEYKAPDPTPDANKEEDENGPKKKKKERDSRIEALSYKRYFRCRAAVTIGHLRKLLQYKLELPASYQIDVIHSDEILDPHFTLMDVAYIYSWRRKSPMQLFFSIVQLERDEQMPCLTREATPPRLETSQTPGSPVALQIDESNAPTAECPTKASCSTAQSEPQSQSSTLSSTIASVASSNNIGSPNVTNVITATPSILPPPPPPPAPVRKKRKQNSPSKKTKKPPVEITEAPKPPAEKIPKVELLNGESSVKVESVLPSGVQVNPQPPPNSAPPGVTIAAATVLAAPPLDNRLAAKMPILPLPHRPPPQLVTANGSAIVILSSDNNKPMPALFHNPTISTR